MEGKKGFTLIELMIIFVIIGTIVCTIVAGQSTKKHRNNYNSKCHCSCCKD